MKRKWKIGIIGLGGIAHMAHFRAFGQLENCEITALCDVDPEKFVPAKAETGEANCYLDHREMLEKEQLDAVVIGTPIFTHKEIAVDAMRKGVNVLCEKPVTINAAEAMKIKRVIDETGVKFMIGMSFRFRPQTRKVLEVINAGKLGETYYCKACYLRKRGIPGYGTWFTDKSQSGGGVTFDLGVHMLDYIWYLLGKPGFKNVSACIYGGIGARIASGDKAGFPGSNYPKTYKGPERNVFDVDEMSSIFIRFDNGVTYHLELSWAMNIEKDVGGGTIFGDRGSVTLSPVVYTHDTLDEVVSEEIPFDNVPSHDIQAKEFLRFLAGEIDNPAPIGDGIQIMQVLDAVYRSAELGKEVSLSGEK